MQHLDYKYRIYPTEAQKAKLECIFGVSRFVYNWALNLRKTEHVSFLESSRRFTKLRNDPAYPWLREIHYDIAGESIKNLQKAYKGFFKKQTGQPSFKKKSNTQSAFFKGHRVIPFPIEGNKVGLAQLGLVKIKWSRELPEKPKYATVTKTASGKYYISFHVGILSLELPKTNKSVGIDLGIKSLATLSDGGEVVNIKSIDMSKKHLSFQRRRMARQIKGSNRRNKQRIKIAKIYEKIKNKRANHIQKATTELVRQYDNIFIEDLNVSGMVKNHNLARSLSDASFGAFKRILEYKCKLYGKNLVKVGRFFPSSKLCSACGVKNEALTLADREWICLQCKAFHLRDHNAAKNILAAGLAVIERGENVRPAS